MQLLQASASSIGSKVLIALTGLGLTVFLIGHLAGNLLFLAGPEAFNHYAHSLISNPFIYAIEMGLVAVFFVHIAKTVAGVLGNRAARPTPYAVRRWAKTKNPRSRKSLASSTMIVTGTITALFVVTHLGTFKFGAHYEAPGGIRDLYRLQLEVFSAPGYVLFYLLAMGVIFFHLWHGVASAAQSLGVDHTQWTPRVVIGGRVLALAIAGGFFMIPIYTFLLSRGAL
jgi:succinate dehydrogenase / fumarate reductase, cytochrome b subunit